MSDVNNHIYTIGGVKIDFPHKAYAAQVAIMDKVVRGCRMSRNCLIESPTGSGKTLALLCSALAWQKVEKERVREVNEQLRLEYNEQLEQALAEAEKKEMEAINAAAASKEASKTSSTVKGNTMKGGVSDNFTLPKTEEDDSDNIVDDNDDGVFRSPKKKKLKTESQSGSEKMASKAPNETAESEPEDVILRINAIFKEESDSNIPKPKFLRSPKIYFGTRTHKQIEQIIKELKKTTYRDARMTILSSREFTCINTMDVEFGRRKKKTWRNKTELCHELLDPKQGMGCLYKMNVEKANMHNKLENYSFPKLWDIEELVHFGKSKKTCPYFVARDLAVTADIIFCPYNYLIHPLIRKSMNINLAGEIMILDEAHNIEDVCRDGSSFSAFLHDLTNAMQDCEKAAESGNLPKEHHGIREFFGLIVQWINDNSDKVKHENDFNQGHAVWTGTEIAASFENAGINKDELERFAANSAEIEKPVESSETNVAHVSLSAAAKAIKDGLLDVLPYIFDDLNRDSFRVLLDRKMEASPQTPLYEESEANSSGWFSRVPERTRVNAGWKYGLNICCMNPAITFKHLKDSLRSVILTSGTLSPIESFQSELGAEFPVKLEANHVIDKSQVWIGTLSCGPKRIPLESTYQNTATYDFQDELGRVILEVCKTVPYGVLCFLSSYTLLEKLMARWESTGLLEEITELKHILSEPRRTDQLQEVMETYYEYVEEKGALFFAVFRGKVSEGINFADNNARCIISVGIPYPNSRDNLIQLKRKFNDELRQKNCDILSGSKWYQIQAYRALNQALGRCIRHKDDWGAILLIDRRFSYKQNTESLSKWIKNMVGYYSDWNSMVSSLANFMEFQSKVGVTE